MEVDEKNVICPANGKEWRQWLSKNHQSQQAVWVVYYKIKSGKPTISWSDAVDEALCFGWIDSIRKTLDGERFIQLFSKRKAKSTWSKINKDKVKQLIKSGAMTKAGLDSIQLAKQNGSWTVLDEVENLTIPKELERALARKKGLKELFETLSRSVKKQMLHRLMFAKQEETKKKRINEILLFLEAQKLKRSAKPVKK